MAHLKKFQGHTIGSRILIDQINAPNDVPASPDGPGDQINNFYGFTLIFNEYSLPLPLSFSSYCLLSHTIFIGTYFALIYSV